MSAFPPPNVYFNGIIYDSDYFISSSSSGLTVSQANAKYLRKTTTDTATALETFTGGIKTNSIDTVASTDNLIINSGTGNTTLGASSGTVYIGSAQVGLGSIIQLGTSVSTARVAGSISTPSIYPSTASGTLTIGNDGLNTISIGGSSGRTAPISIGTGSSTANGTVLISNNANSTSSIKIGDGSGQSSNIFIGSNNATAPASTFNNVLIGASTKSLYLNGTIYMNDGGGSLTMGSSGTSYISLGAMNTTFNIGGSTSPFNLSSPIIPQYDYPVAAGRIGFVSSPYSMSGLPLTTSPFATGTITTSGLAIGIYIGIVRYHINPSSATAKIAFSTSGSIGITLYGNNDVSYNAYGTAADGFDNNLTIFLQVTNATTSSMYFSLYSATANSTMTSCTMYVMRIA